jgi:hypothetical protein
MSEYLELLIAIAASLYGFSYARWLKANGNITGAISMYTLIAAVLSIPVAKRFWGI